MWGIFMYDDIINSITYSMVFDFGRFNDILFNFLSVHSFDFFELLGVALGIGFLKKAFNSCN